MTSLPEKYRYIVVEGPIGAGKTSLARVMGERSGSSLLLEEPDANPFLPGFYQDRARYALPTQLYFLFQRARQVRALSQSDLFSTVTISDFMLEKDPLFARVTLSDDELTLYDQVYASLKPQAPTPDLVIYLQASPQTLVDRVRRRAARKSGRCACGCRRSRLPGSWRWPSPPRRRRSRRRRSRSPTRLRWQVSSRPVVIEKTTALAPIQQ